jgi:hypothetical protein
MRLNTAYATRKFRASLPHLKALVNSFFFMTPEGAHLLEKYENFLLEQGELVLL